MLPMSRQGRPCGLDFLSLSPGLGEEGHVPHSQATGSLGAVAHGCLILRGASLASSHPIPVTGAADGHVA